MSSRYFRHCDAKEDSFARNVAEAIVETKLVFTTLISLIAAQYKHIYCSVYLHATKLTALHQTVCRCCCCYYYYFFMPSVVKVPDG